MAETPQIANPVAVSVDKPRLIPSRRPRAITAAKVTVTTPSTRIRPAPPIAVASSRDSRNPSSTMPMRNPWRATSSAPGWSAARCPDTFTTRAPSTTATTSGDRAGMNVPISWLAAATAPTATSPGVRRHKSIRDHRSCTVAPGPPCASVPGRVRPLNRAPPPAGPALWSSTSPRLGSERAGAGDLDPVQHPPIGRVDRGALVVGAPVVPHDDVPGPPLVRPVEAVLVDVGHERSEKLA